MLGMHFNDPLDPAVKTDWVRLWDCRVTWKDIHLGPNNYDWTRLDYLVNLYSDRNILYVFAATPKWLSQKPYPPHPAPWLGEGSNSLPVDIEEWNKFVWMLSKRYAGKIQAYEIWNEPQLVDFMYPYNKKTIKTLVTMTKRAYKTIKINDKNALVISASVLPRASSGGMKRANRYLKALKKQGWPVDRVACHIYPEIGLGPQQWYTYLQDVKKSVKDLGGPLLVWVTETNYNLLGSKLDPIISERYVRQTYRYARKSPVFWYGWNKDDILGGLIINHNSAAWNEMQKHLDNK
jgi:polysaccharide biosynthesis protein PslG